MIMNNMWLFIQAILTTCVVIFLVINLFLNVELLIKIFLILTLLIMSYNNYKIYKRKGFTILYLIASLIVLIGIFYG